MKTREIEVESRVTPGLKKKALLVVCECGCELFNIFVLEGKHQHLQCFGCDEIYCDGSCGENLEPKED